MSLFAGDLFHSLPSSLHEHHLSSTREQATYFTMIMFSSCLLAVVVGTFVCILQFCTTTIVGKKQASGSLAA
jgi:hypothetical protein